eukprot:352137_1
MSQEENKYDNNQDINDFIKQKSLSNPLVIIVGLSKYDGSENDLPFVEKDKVSFRDVCQNKYNFTVCPSDKVCSNYRYKKYWTENDIMNFIEISRKSLYQNEDKNIFKHDGIVLYFSGHGHEGCIVSSDLHKIKIYKLQDKIGGIWKASTSKIPKLCIFDCCRGSIWKNDEILNSAGGHKDELFCSLYGNTMGIVAKGDDNGSYFTRSICDVLRTGNINYLNNITDFSIKIGNGLKKYTKNTQIIRKEGDPNLDKYSIKQNKKFKWNADTTHPDIAIDGNVITNKNTDNYFKWHSAFSVDCVGRGSISWRLKVVKIKKYMMIGIMSNPKAENAQVFFWEVSGGYVYGEDGFSRKGKGTPSTYPTNDFNQNYGESFGANDIITVHLNLDNGQLSFSKNNINQGMAYKVPNTKYYLGVGLVGLHDCVEFLAME